MRKRLLAELLVIVMILAMMPVMAFADSSEQDSLEQIGEQIQDPSDDPFDYKTSRARLRSNSSSDFPVQLDLRDEGLVTPVKFQNPFGTCWGFAAIAAGCLPGERRVIITSLSVTLRHRFLTTIEMAVTDNYLDNERYSIPPLNAPTT